MFSGRITRVRRIALIVLTLVLTLGMVGSAEAARKKKKEDEKDRGKQFTISSEQLGKKLNAAYELMQADKYQEAFEILEELEKRAERYNKYERALVYQLLGQVYGQDEKYDEALVYFEKSIAEEGLPNAQILNIRFSIAQLDMATGKFDKAVEMLEAWLKEVETPNANAYYLLAAAYYQLGQIDKAIGPAETAIEIAKEPKAPWLQLLVGLYYEVKQYPKAVKPLETLIMIDPKKAYWTQLSSLYNHLDQDAKSLAVMQLAYAQDFLDTNTDLRSLAQLYLYRQLPYQAGMVLEKARKDEHIVTDALYWEMLANSWMLARETDRAIPALEQGAELSEKGNMFAQLGRVYVEREQWPEAVEALKNAIDKGGLSDEGNARLLLAIAYYQQKQYGNALRQLRVASKSDTESVRNSAEQWIKLVERDSEAGRAESGEPSSEPEADEGAPDEKSTAQSADEKPAAVAGQATPPGGAPQAEQVSQRAQ